MPADGVREAIAWLEADTLLWQPDAVRGRLEALDALDGLRTDGEEIDEQIDDVRARLEGANEAVYESIRREPRTLLH